MQTITASKKNSQLWAFGTMPLQPPLDLKIDWAEENRIQPDDLFETLHPDGRRYEGASSSS